MVHDICVFCMNLNGQDNLNLCIVIFNMLRYLAQQQTVNLNTNKAATQSPRLPYEIIQFCELLIQKQLNQLDELLSVTNS